MQPQLTFALATARHEELLDRASAHRRRRRAAESAPRPFWEGLTLRPATGADRSALARLAELDQAERPAEPVLLGVVSQRPVAALSLSDGRVVADPFFRTVELVELMRLRARQLSRR